MVRCGKFILELASRIIHLDQHLICIVRALCYCPPAQTGCAKVCELMKKPLLSVCQTFILRRNRSGSTWENTCVSCKQFPTHLPVKEIYQHNILVSLKMICHFRVIGLPPEEEWPTDVTLSRKNFPPLLPGPITDFVPEINEQGAQLLLVSSSYILHGSSFRPVTDRISLTVC